MNKIQLQPYDSTFTYKGQTIRIKNVNQNPFTGLWTFDLYWKDGNILGVPISTGTSVIKGNGTPFNKLVFLDSVSSNGDITVPANTLMYILEEDE